MANKPRPVDFLVIGAQKAATSWLWEIMRQYPSIWVPPRKELHYFDRSLKYDSPSILATDNPLVRLFSHQTHNRQYRQELLLACRSVMKSGHWRDMKWYLRYYLGKISDHWYLSLFREADDSMIMGEITPAYAILDKPDIMHIKKLFPELKIIFVMRNPIDRAWSQLRYGWTRGNIKDIKDIDVLKQLIDGPNMEKRSNYISTLDNWMSFFPESQVCIMFYDNALEDPEKFLVTIFRFLGVGETSDTSTSIEKINASRAHDMPDEIRQYLARKYMEQLIVLSSRFGGHAARWLEEAETICRSDHRSGGSIIDHQSENRLPR